MRKIVDKIKNEAIGFFWLAVLCGGLFCCSKCSQYVFASEIVKKCKRPRWKVVYVEELGCKMRFNHYLLYKEAKKLKRPITYDIDKGFCWIKTGTWHVKASQGILTTHDKNQLQIDHILPFAYLARRIDCSQVDDYYNFEDNLQVVEAKYNRHKSDKICENEDDCKKQKEICTAMAKTFNNEHLCDDL